MTIRTAADVFAPMSTEEFISDYLEKKVLLLERNDPTLVEGLFDMDTLEKSIRFGAHDLRRALRVIPGDDRAELQLASAFGVDVSGEVIEEFGKGSTVILNRAGAHVPCLTGLIEKLEHALHCNIVCNVYATPSASQGFSTHVDGHDVLILQTHGYKTWRIHEVPEQGHGVGLGSGELPLEQSDMVAAIVPRLASAPDFGEPIQEVTLKPGDLLYLPRGVPHSAEALEDPSIHLTIGLYPTRRHQLLHSLVDMVALHDVELRKRVSREIGQGREQLPPLGDMFRSLADTADRCGDLIDTELLVRLLTMPDSRPTTAQTLASIRMAEQLHGQTVVRAVSENPFTWMRLPDEIRVQCGSHMALPVKLEPAMDFLKENKSFRVCDMPDFLAPTAKVVLARNLVKSGLFVIEDLGEPEETEAEKREKFFELSNALGGF